MLCGIKIKNFKSIADEQRLNNLGLLNTLTGSNNSGKTAILEAVWFFSKILSENPSVLQALVNSRIVLGGHLNKILTYNPKATILDLFHNKTYKKPIEIEFSFKIEKSLEDLFKREGSHTLDGVFRKEIVDFDVLSINLIVDGNVVALGGISWGNLKLSAPDSPRNFLDVISYLRGSAQKRYNVTIAQSIYQEIFVPALVKSFQELKVLYIRSARKILPIVNLDDAGEDSDGAFLKRELFRLYHGNPVENEKYDNILRVFHKVTGKQINDKPFYNKERHCADIVFKEGDVFIDIDASGYGYYQLLNIIYNIVSYDSSIVLIDEPEISLHPQAQITLFDAIESIARVEKKQFFLATHSPYFIDFSYMDSIFKFTKNGDATSISQINNDVERGSKSKIDLGKDMVLNSKCRELLFLNEVIFVEGPDDSEFFLKLIDEKQVEIQAPINKFIEIGGYRQDRVKKLVDFCREFNIDYKFFFDFDYYLYNPQIERLINALKQMKVCDQVFLRMLENFIKMNWKEKKKHKPEIEEKWHSLYLKYWEDRNIIDLLNQEKQENIYILPAMDIGVIANEMGSNESLKQIVIQLFADN